MEPGCTVIVMDHDASVSVLIEEILLSEGYTVRRCNGTRFTIDALEHTHPDGLIMDLGRADADTAVALLRQIRQHPSLRGMGVLLTSTDNRLLEDLGPHLRQLYCNAVPKPFDLCEFLGQLQQSLMSVGQLTRCA